MAEFTEALEKVKIMLLNSESGSNYSTEANSMPDVDIPAVRKILANFLVDSSSDGKATYAGLKECGMNINENSPCAFVKLYLEDLDVYLNTVWVHGLFRLYDALNNCFTDNNLYIIPTAFSFDTIDLFVVSKNGSTDFFQDISTFFDSTGTICADVLNLTVQLEIIHTADSILKFNIKPEVSPITDANSLFESIVNHMPCKLPSYCGKNFDDTLLFAKFLVLNFSEHCNDFVNTISPMLGRLSAAASIGELNDAVSDIIAEISAYFDNRKTYNEKITQLCIDYINLHYGENISLTKISGELNISTSQLSKIFKKTLKVKYVDYLNTVRLEKAKGLLRETNQSIKNISSAVGYTSYPYFLRVFKIHTGKTPLEYRTDKNGEPSD